GTVCRGAGDPRGRQERMCRSEQAGAGVQDHGHSSRHPLEALLELQPQLLEAIEGAFCAIPVFLLEADGEAKRVGLGPGPPLRVDPWAVRLPRATASDEFI